MKGITFIAYIDYRAQRKLSKEGNKYSNVSTSNKEPRRNQRTAFTDEQALRKCSFLYQNDFDGLRSKVNNDVIGRNKAEPLSN